MSGYVTTLRGMTKGRASYYMEPSHYQEVPRNITQKIIAASGKTAHAPDSTNW
jgi:elongation factor G